MGYGAGGGGNRVVSHQQQISIPEYSWAGAYNVETSLKLSRYGSNVWMGGLQGTFMYSALSSMGDNNQDTN